MANSSISASQETLGSIAALAAGGDLPVAKTQIDRLLERDATNADVWHAKGEIHRQMGDHAAAASAYNQALKLRPDAMHSCFSLAQALEASGKTELAIKTYEHWLKILQTGSRKKPVTVDAETAKTMERLVQEGNARTQRKDFEGAIAAYRKVLDISPDSPAALSNMAAAFFYLRQLEEAERLLLQALRTNPGYTTALNILGGCYKDSKRTLLAIAAYRQCVALDAKFLMAWSNLGKCYLDIKFYNEAVASHEKVLSIDPSHADSLGWLLHLLHYTCKWDRSVELRQRFSDVLHAGATVEPFMVVVHIPEAHLGNARRWAKQQYPRSVAYDVLRPLPADARADGKLRIGYVSSDFQRHATAALISEMFEHHDRSRFEIYAYSHGKNDGGQERQRIIQSVDGFRDVESISDAAACERIRDDGIDILVDIKGYTNGQRLGIAAQRPAPLAMHYLGFPGSIGANFIDYFFGDAVTTPEGSDAQFQEALIRLPHSYQMNDRKRPLPIPKPRSYYELPNEGVVFCNFNSVYKIMPETFAIWMRVLKAVPNSVMWFFITNIYTVMNLRTAAHAHGVDAKRLVFGGEMNLAEHLSRYQHVDLVLDVTPCSGHTTTSDALWCGAPVLTMTDPYFPGRVSAGLLSAVGLPQLITHSPEEYEARAIALASDPKKLAELRQYLEAGRMTFPLFDSLATTRAIEQAYLRAAELHRKGEKPRAFSITPDLKPV